MSYLIFIFKKSQNKLDTIPNTYSLPDLSFLEFEKFPFTKKLFFKKPIIEYSILEAKKTKLFKHIIVTTDCNKIANISKKAGVSILKRPKRLAHNDVGIVEVIKDCLLKIKNENIYPKYVCCIFPAAPLIEKKK